MNNSQSQNKGEQAEISFEPDDRERLDYEIFAKMINQHVRPPRCNWHAGLRANEKFNLTGCQRMILICAFIDVHNWYTNQEYRNAVLMEEDKSAKKNHGWFDSNSFARTKIILTPYKLFT